MENPTPFRQGGNLGPVRVDLVPVVLSETSVEINLVSAKPASALPKVAAGPEDENNRQGEDLLEEIIGSFARGRWIFALGRRTHVDSNVDLGGENNKAEKEAEVRAIDATSSLEGDAVHGTALPDPSSAETNVSLWG